MQLYRRRPELVAAVHFHGQKLPGLERAIGKRTGPHHTRGIPGVWTVSGWTALSLGDWIVMYGDGTRAVYPDQLFQLAFEPT